MRYVHVVNEANSIARGLEDARQVMQSENSPIEIFKNYTNGVSILTNDDGDSGNLNKYLSEGITVLVDKNRSLNTSISSLKNSITSSASAYKRREMQKIADKNKPVEQYYGED